MKKPSELMEKEAIAIICKDGAGIGFHRYYGQLNTFALPTGDDPRSLRGLQIGEGEEFADELFAAWADKVSDILQIHLIRSPQVFVWPEGWGAAHPRPEDDEPVDA